MTMLDCSKTIFGAILCWFSCAHPTPKAHGDHVVCDLFHLQSMEENQKPLEILEMTGKLGYKTKANWDLWWIYRTK